MTLPVGSKDLTQAVSQSQQGSRANCQSPSHLCNHSDSSTHAHVKQQSSHAFSNESIHFGQEGQDTLKNCHSSDGTTLPIGGTACPPATANAPLEVEDSLQVGDIQHRTQSSSVMLPDATSSLQTISNADQEQDSRSNRDQKKTCALPYILFAIDGTWQEAQEIYKV